jgi:phenylpropionate dioxygenase-like ring-hydroxylating dioxygenase large terminal subunit
MLVTRQPLLRRFWHPVAPATALGDAPLPFTLLGEDIVLWRAADGAPACVRDRCCHRTAKLSRGWTDQGSIVCGYHGWAYDGSGAVVAIPQRPEGGIPQGLKTEAFRVEERHGVIWVALAEPLYGIPDIPEAGDPAYRRVDEFYEVWDAPGLRIMENSFDNAHFSYVHAKSFGIVEEPEPAPLSIEQTADGFLMRALVPVKNPDIQKKNLKDAGDFTVRDYEKTWWAPFSRKMKITYPNGLIHIICTLTAPIDDRRSMVTQFALRTDSEADAPAADIIAFDRQVTLEDQAILAICDPDVPLRAARGGEVSIPSDEPGLEMRRHLLKLLIDAGEAEATGEPPTTAVLSAAAE